MARVARAPRCNQHHWHERRGNQRRCHQCRSNQRLGHQRAYQARSQRPTRSLRRRPPFTIAGRQHCRCHLRDLRNFHRPLVRQLRRCRLFQTNPPRTSPGASHATSPSCPTCSAGRCRQAGRDEVAAAHSRMSAPCRLVLQLRTYRCNAADDTTGQQRRWALTICSASRRRTRRGPCPQIANARDTPVFRD